MPFDVLHYNVDLYNEMNWIDDYAAQLVQERLLIYVGCYKTEITF